MTLKWKWFAAASAAVAMAAAVAPWTFSGAAMRRELARQVFATTGLITSSEGRAVFALLPRPRIKIENVRVRDEAGNLDIDAEWLRGDLRLLPIFAGRMELASATLVNPKLSIDLEGNPFNRQGAIGRAMEPSSAPANENMSGAVERLGVVTLSNATANLKSAARGLDVTIEQIDLTLDWRSLASPAVVKGAFRLDGEPAEVAAWFGKPGDLLGGKPSELSLRVTSPAVNLNLNGTLGGGPRLQFDGNFSASARKPRALFSGPGRGLPLPGRLENLTLAGSTRMRWNSFALTDLRLGVDGNNFEGALTLEIDRPRPKLSGTLAAESLDVAAFFADAPAPIQFGREWSREPMPAPNLGALDVDLRVSAARARAGRVVLRDAAASMLIANGRAEVSLVEAKLFNGLARVRGSMQSLPGGYETRLSGSLAGVNSAALMSEAFHSNRVSGELGAEISLTSEGDTVLRALRGLSGEARFRLKSGDISGLDLETALRRLEKRPLSIASEVRSGRTAFNSALLDLKIEKGRATIREANVSGPGVIFEVVGSANIPDRGLALALSARQTGDGAAGRADGPGLTLEISGDWNEPQLALDARSLISRSEAAAPLLRSLKPAAPQAVDATNHIPD